MTTVVTEITLIGTSEAEAVKMVLPGMSNYADLLDPFPTSRVCIARINPNKDELAHMIAGYLSTIEFRPSREHPIELLPVAHRVVQMIGGQP